jgi:hypothetical protein
MSKMAAKCVSAPPADDLRRTFESAIAQMQQAPLPLSPSQTPIFVRRQRMMPNDSAAENEKRALTAAARALAQLWNISPSLIR